MGDPYYYTWSAQDKVVPLPIESAMGGVFQCQGGKQVWDAVSCSYQASFGHSHSYILQAVKSQLDDALVLPPKARTIQRERVTNRLLDLLGVSEKVEGKGKVFYTVSGAESIENALKIAREIRGTAQVVAARARSYHGATLGAMSVSGDWRHQGHFGVQDYTLRIPEPEDDPSAEKTRMLIESFGSEKIAAFCLETVPGGSGVNVPPQSWWDGIQKIARSHGIFLIIDEVLCGFARTGKHFAFHHFGIEPDFVCMAKAITGGYVPFGALWTSQKIADYYATNTLSCGLTSYAHPLGLAAVEAVIGIVESAEFQSHMRGLVLAFSKQLQLLGEHEMVKEIRSIGMLAAVELKKPERYSVQDFWDKGVFVHKPGTYFMLAPPFILNENNLQEIFQQIQEVLNGQVQL